MEKSEFELLLTTATKQLDVEIRDPNRFATSKDFENRVRHVLESCGQSLGIEIDYSPHPHAFPDIVIGEFGVEVKFSDKDTWRSIANSIFEGRRSNEVKQIYVIFGKKGGTPAVKWANYAESIIHVRTSHVPRFEIELDSNRQSLFTQFGLTYETFQRLETEEKMEHVRHYARSRLNKGERLWWLETGKDETDHSVELQARLYTSLDDAEKRKMRAEAALLCPSIVKPPSSKGKYDDAAHFLLDYRGILCPQVRDLFSAGSVALKSDSTRGGKYIERSLRDIEVEMKSAASTLEDALFVEYWGRSVAPDKRIAEWLKIADQYAKGKWTPSKTLFIS
jgi:hypothetical protein